jgi:hypothetical protein
MKSVRRSPRIWGRGGTSRLPSMSIKSDVTHVTHTAVSSHLCVVSSGQGWQEAFGCVAQKTLGKVWEGEGAGLTGQGEMVMTKRGGCRHNI